MEDVNAECADGDEPEKIVILNENGTVVIVEKEDIYNIVAKGLHHIAKNLHAYLVTHGMEIGRYEISGTYPDYFEFIKSYKELVKKRNQEILYSLMSVATQNYRKERDRLAKLAKDLDLKVDWDTFDWNKFALEESKKEREDNDQPVKGIAI